MVVIASPEVVLGRFWNEHDALADRWLSLMERLFLKENNALEKKQGLIERLESIRRVLKSDSGYISAFENLFSLYSEKERYYHNVTHIKDCFAEFDSAKAIVQKPIVLELAIWYHDTIYDTKAKDNEERSAQLALDTLKKLGAPEEASKSVYELILATKHIEEPCSADGKILVDIDLSIFGKPEIGRASCRERV